MKVNINGVVYDAESQPILIELNEQDIDNIVYYPNEDGIYIISPKSMSAEEVKTILKLK